ncbi:MAG: anaerobic ribonucleoside-triphosphate reductase activating protein [Clostridia bacterium]|nr:anaerobic ribonucleoside-triphosphate reductase activating protein [Clostridia bacterium]
MKYNGIDLNSEISISGITYSSAVDGVGFRDVLFVNYCPHHCDGCHNPETWDKANGRIVTLQSVYEDLTKSGLTNITFSGGEPFEQARELAFLAKYIRENHGKNFWVYSGYTFEQIIADPEKKVLLEQCDVLVDGRFEKNNRQQNMRFRGSLNQRIIDIKKSLETGEVVLYDLDW